MICVITMAYVYTLYTYIHHTYVHTYKHACISTSRWINIHLEIICENMPKKILDVCTSYIRVESCTLMHSNGSVNTFMSMQGCFHMEIRVTSAARSWTVCKYMYISEVNIRSLRHPCRERDAWSTHRRYARWSGRRFLSRSSRLNHRSGLQEARSSPHPWHSHPQPDKSWPRSRAYPRLFAWPSWESHSAGGFGNSSAPTTGAAIMFGSGWFLDLPYRVVAIRQVLNTGDAHRARQHVCPAGSPGMAGGFAQWRFTTDFRFWSIILTIPKHSVSQSDLCSLLFARARSLPLSNLSAVSHKTFSE